jgi:LysR family transcriptional regulator, benzoate and cis,cis-muconate-responsive activator of ben and cat genes
MPFPAAGTIVFAIRVELRHMRYFVAVAEELHFSRAAERLHIAQPALSAQIRRLEEELGVPLLLRSTRHVELTEAGRVFLVKARRALGAVEDAVSAAQSLGRGEVGELTLGVTPQSRHEITPTVLRLFRERHPGIHVSKREQGTTPLLADVLRGRLDAAIGFCPTLPPELSSVLVKAEPVVAAVAAGDELASRPSISFADLDGLPLLLPSRRKADGSVRAISERCRGRGFEPVLAPVDTDNDENFELVSRGLGVALPSVDFVGGHQVPGIAIVPVEPPETFPVELVWRSEDENPVVARLVEFVEEIRDSVSWKLGR